MSNLLYGDAFQYYYDYCEEFNEEKFMENIIGYYHYKYETDVPYDLGLKRRDFWGDGEYSKENIIKCPHKKKKTGKNKYRGKRSNYYAYRTNLPSAFFSNKRRTERARKATREEVIAYTKEWEHIDHYEICAAYNLIVQDYWKTMMELLDEGILVENDCNSVVRCFSVKKGL